MDIFAQNEEGEVKKDNVTFSIVEGAYFNRKIKCEGCLEKNVPQNKNITIVISANFSNKVSGKIRDFFPIEWKLVENKEGKIHAFSKTHNYIEWEMESKSAEFEYVVSAPPTVLTKKYEFKTFLNNYSLGKDDIVLYRFYKFLPLKKQQENIKIEPILETEYPHISNENPLVINLNYNNIDLVALFPKKNENDVTAKIYSLPKEENEEFRIQVESEIGQDNLEKVLVRFKIKNHGASILKNADIYLKDEYGNVEKLEKDINQKTSGYTYYDAFSDKEGEFFLIVN